MGLNRPVVPLSLKFVIPAKKLNENYLQLLLLAMLKFNCILILVFIL